MNAMLLYVLIACSGVMLYSAYMRLILYEEAYGYTYIRFLVHAFMIFLAILLIIAALRIRTPMIPLTKIYIVIGLAAYVFINYVGMDRIIAEKNIERFKANGEIDFVYLSQLSADAIPTLAKFAEQDFPDMKRYLENTRTTIAEADRAWPSFNASVYRAEMALNELRE